MSSNDSVRVVQKDEHVRRLHSHQSQTGKLYRGQTKPLASASIPSKYQTVVLSNSDKKGFMSNSKRFNYDIWTNDKPGPGSYLGVPVIESNTVSCSKRGTGMFASKNSRMPERSGWTGPAPNSYNMPPLLSSRSDFNRSAVSCSFHPPIAMQRTRSTGPAPNQYNVMNVPIGRANNVHADAAFKSQSKREIVGFGDNDKPSPCQYNVSFVQDNVRVPLSSFKSRSSRQFPPPPSENPGPAEYKPHEPVKTASNRTLFPRHSYLLLAAPAIKLPSPPVAPGPGSYELNRTFERANTSASSSFVSSERRWASEGQSSWLPGPAHYNPVKVGKQSFIYNSSSRWL